MHSDQGGLYTSKILSTFWGIVQKTGQFYLTIYTAWPKQSTGLFRISNTEVKTSWGEDTHYGESITLPGNYKVRELISYFVFIHRLRTQQLQSTN